MRHGGNPLAVTESVKKKIQELQPGLPEGVHIIPAYDRVSRQAKPASHRQVKTSHFEKGNIRPTGLLAAVPQKEACDGECAQDGARRLDFIVTCATLVAAADRS
jgi:hypothetical protein